jgi:hypothetical protein
VPRLISMTLISSNVGVGSEIVLMPHGYRLQRSGLPDPMEVLPILARARGPDEPQSHQESQTGLPITGSR